MIGFQCPLCRNYWGDGKCNAFERGIPVAILRGEHDHTTPFKGDGGVRYAPMGKQLEYEIPDKTKRSITK